VNFTISERSYLLNGTTSLTFYPRWCGTYSYVGDTLVAHCDQKFSALKKLFPSDWNFYLKHYFLGKWYFDTTFSLTSVWHSDVACAVLRDNERENTVVFSIPSLRHMCVFQNYKQRTIYFNWANHLVFSLLKHVCVPKLHTTNHLFELS